MNLRQGASQTAAWTTAPRPLGEQQRGRGAQTLTIPLNPVLLQAKPTPLYAAT